jgi:hypothetical protein
MVSSVQIHGGQRRILIPQAFSNITRHGRIGRNKKRIAFRIAVSDDGYANHIANHRPKYRFIGSHITGLENINGREKAW